MENRWSKHGNPNSVISRHLLYLKGIPASGKSSFAKDLLRKDSTYKRVNKDDLRSMLDDSQWSKERETVIESTRDNLILQFLLEGFNVIVDDTNIHDKHWTRVNELAEYWSQVSGGFAVVEERFFDVPVDECLRRNAEREGRNKVPSKVIRDMHRQLVQDTRERPYRPYVPGLPTCIVADLDGTLALLNGRNPYNAKGCINDIPNEPVVGLLKELANSCTVILVSGREEKDRRETTQWLINHHIPCDDLYMRPTGDRTSDDVLKRGIYETYILPRFNVRFVLDDRDRVVNAIRDLGIPVFQVAFGNF